MARSKAFPAPARGKRVPLLIMIVHPKSMGKPRSITKRKTTAKSKR
jgi:hypothetical protein